MSDKRQAAAERRRRYNDGDMSPEEIESYEDHEMAPDLSILADAYLASLSEPAAPEVESSCFHRFSPKDKKCISCGLDVLDFVRDPASDDQIVESIHARLSPQEVRVWFITHGEIHDAAVACARVDGIDKAVSEVRNLFTAWLAAPRAADVFENPADQMR